MFQAETLLSTLKSRFEKHPERHEGAVWTDVLDRLEMFPEKLRCLYEMENSGGEPDIAGFDADTGEYLFIDCSAQSPSGRRNICYDREAMESRKTNRPEGNAADMADAMGIEILSETQYRELQRLGSFDTKTSSWLHTPRDIRALGGALFSERRYRQVFVYHNSAQSYFGVRGFRGLLRV